MSDVKNLQKEWDRILIIGFYKAYPTKMFILLSGFKRDRNLTDDDILKLKRIPTGWNHRNVAPRRFVCAFLPKIADILWRHQIEELDTLASAMSKIKYDVLKTECDHDKISADRNEIAKSRRAMRQAGMSVQLSKKWHKAINSSVNWNTTK